MTEVGKAKELSKNNCQTIENGYDLDELAEQNWRIGLEEYMPTPATHVTSFKAGFQKALELLGDKKFSEHHTRLMLVDMARFICSKEMRDAWDFDIQKFHRDRDFFIDKQIQSLQQTESLVTFNPDEKDSDGCLILKVSNMKEITIDGVTYSLTPKEEIKQETKLPKTWEELEEVIGCFILTNSEISRFSTYHVNSETKNVFTTKEQAEASIALAQLSQLLKVYRGDWNPNWKDDNCKYAIKFWKDVLEISSLVCSNAFITLPTEELAQEFLDNFRDLIEKAKPLL